MNQTNESTLDAVGRRGALSYEFERQGSRTVLARSSCSSPWHHFPPSYLDDSGCAYTWLVNPSGGLVGGDHVSIEAQLHTGTHVLMTSPSANRVYRSLAEPAVQEVRLSVGPDARLEWVPEVTIPFAGSRFRQSIHVDLAPGATAVLWDTMASGRVAKQERWAFASVENEICIRGLAPPSSAVPVPFLPVRVPFLPARGQPSRRAPVPGSVPWSVVERYCLVPGSLPAPLGLVENWDYVASFFVIGDAVGAEVWKHLDEVLAAIMEQRSGPVLGGVSTLAAPGLVVKLVARSAPDLTEMLEAIWGAVRANLWNLPLPNLRRY
ncbi:MAG: urease accessory protein UreD [Nitrospira sp. CG24E]|nr:MAG: urease accessory protein UreD [Nitrospira sp. CG24E]